MNKRYWCGCLEAGKTLFKCIYLVFMLLAKIQVYIKTYVSSWSYTWGLLFSCLFFLFRLNNPTAMDFNIFFPYFWSFVKTTGLSSVLLSQARNCSFECFWAHWSLTKCMCYSLQNLFPQPVFLFLFFPPKVIFFIFSYLHSQHTFTLKA